MREIKFRGKLINSGKWSEGNLIIRKGNNAEIMACTSPDATPIGTYGRIDADTIGQYTELHDKNGKEIYEGDIFSLGDRKILYIVEWIDTGLKGRQNGNRSTVGLEYWKNNIEVIGNIYDNPELLEV